MTKRKRLLSGVLILAVVGAISAVVARRVYRSYWEDTGDYAGPLTRAPVAYNPAIAPSRGWADGPHDAPPPTTFHAYPASAINGQETYYLLYLPPGYDDPANRDRRYPVVYWFHGFSVDPQCGMPFVDGLDAAIRAGHAPSTIVVLPHGLYDSWFVDSADGSQPVESVIIKDLIPLIDRTYRTVADRRGRALEGFSMGGWAALHYAFKYPELFCAVTSVSAPLHKAGAFPQLKRIFSGDTAAYWAEDPVTRARRDAPRLANTTRIRLWVGEKDRNVRYNVAFDARLTEWGVPHELTVIRGVSQQHADAELYDRLGVGAFDFYKAAFAAVVP